MTGTTFTGRATDEISFPLGGIGTGSIGLAGNGRLIDWEIFGHPNKGSDNGHTHFAVKAERDGKLLDARVLCGDVFKNLAGQTGKDYGFGLSNTTMQGFPHFRDCVFRGEFPVAEVSLDDPDSPVSVKLTAFNPFIPQNAKDSSIPAALFETEVTNKTGETIDLTLAGTLRNPSQRSVNLFTESGAKKGILLSGAPEEGKEQEPDGMALFTDADDISYQENWYRGGWYDYLETYWRNFTEMPRFVNRHYETPGNTDCATLAAHMKLSGRSSEKIRFVISWYYPMKRGLQMEGTGRADVRNYYSYIFESAGDTAGYVLDNWKRLRDDTFRWHDELFACTLPEEVIEAVSATSSVLKSETSIRFGEKGDFYGWEGLGEHGGSCSGTCTHVWNYAYAMPFLFPELERGLRENDYRYNERPDGGMVFRTTIPFGTGRGGFRPCVDGQFGGIMKVYREWKLSGDTEWLRGIWGDVKRSLEFAWSPENADRWDADRDGVLEGRQHHTLDMELFGPSSWLEGFYLGALKAASEMARALGDEDADEYTALFEKGKNFTEKELFNGRYFIQKIDLKDKALVDLFGADHYWNSEAGEIKYQIGEGCEIDGLLAQWHADIMGLGDLFDPDEVKTALGNMFSYNFKESMRSHYNTFRLFAVNDEAGAVICDYPEGAQKPAIPIPYAQESMHGFEYAFAGLLISRGFLKEGLRVVKAVCDRYRGYNRNPWNEIECGSNYARSMASFALIPIISGMRFDLTRGMLGFDPLTGHEGFRTVWFTGNAWGNLTIGEETRLTVISGEMKLERLELPYLDDVKSVTIDGKPADFTFSDGAVSFAGTTVAKEIVVR